MNDKEIEKFIKDHPPELTEDQYNKLIKDWANNLIKRIKDEKMSDKEKEIKHLKEQITKAEKVISYYANPENWDFEEILDDLEFCEDSQAELGGKRARKYLFDKD